MLLSVMTYTRVITYLAVRRQCARRLAVINRSTGATVFANLWYEQSSLTYHGG